MDGFILLYSVTDRKSYNYIVNVLNNIHRNDRYSSTAVIVVANKTDLVRKRQVADRGTLYVTLPYVRHLHVGLAAGRQVYVNTKVSYPKQTARQHS